MKFSLFGFLPILLFSCSKCVSGTVLAGVTIKSPPFIMTENNKFRGLCVDLMNEIQKRTGIKYSLYLVEDNLYGPGRMASGKMTGMIADVHNKKADFAIADMTVTALRQQYITFTEPFFTFSISALLQKRFAKNLKTIDDLAIKSNLSVGAFSGSNTLANMQRIRTTVRTINWLYRKISANESNLVRTKEEAMYKVLHEPYAFIGEEPKNTYKASQDCNLAVLKDPSYYIYGKYAIAFRPDSPYLAVFNSTLKKLEAEGFLEKLKQKHFNVGCLKASAAVSTNSLFVLFSSLFVGFYSFLKI